MKTKSLYPYLVVEELDKALKFYTEGLGFTVKHSVARLDGGKVVVLESAAGQQFELMEIPKGAPGVLKAGDFGMRMNVESLDAALAELREKGYEVSGKILETDMLKGLPLKDPSGFAITLFEHKK